jgi:hypothetical protein
VFSTAKRGENLQTKVFTLNEEQKL